MSKDGEKPQKRSKEMGEVEKSPQTLSPEQFKRFTDAFGQRTFNAIISTLCDPDILYDESTKKVKDYIKTSEQAWKRISGEEKAVYKERFEPMLGRISSAQSEKSRPIIQEIREKLSQVRLASRQLLDIARDRLGIAP